MQNENFKKIIIYTIIILFISILSYFFFFKKETSIILDNDSESLFPVGEVGDVNLGKDFETLKNDPEYNINQNSVQQIPVLRKISKNPVAGAFIFSPEKNSKKEIEDYSIIRYIEKTTGHIYETKTNSLAQERISNKTIPKIHETKWLDENNFIFNYLDENVIKTYSAVLKPNASSTNLMELEGNYLQNDIQNIIYFNENLFYLINSGTESRGILVDKENKQPKQIFDSPLKEWLINNIDNKFISFTTKPIENALGYMFIFNTTTKKFEKVLDKKLNLSTLPNKDLNILYSYNSNLGHQLSLYNYKEKITTNISVSTFPEKCVWDNNNTDIFCGVPSQGINYKDLTNWYKGNILFSDDIWKIDTENNITKKIISPIDIENEGIDIINLSISENNDYLLFMNKKDYSLWGLQLISSEIN